MKPFSGIRVLDLTHVLAGPFSAYQLAIMGADVIKIESPDHPDVARPVGSVQHLNRKGMGTSFLTQNSNKRAITLNLKTERGKELFRELSASADVIVENYRAGAIEALGLGYSEIAELNPSIIYCSMTGFGQTGPKRGHTAYDNVIQAISGLMTTTGHVGSSSPLKVGPPILDYFSGTMAAFSIASALFQRMKTGRGQRIDVSMMDSAVMLMAWTVTDFLNGGGAPRIWGNDSDNAGYSCYDTADGLLMVGAEAPSQQRRMWKMLGRDDLAVDQTFEQVLSKRDEHAPILAEIFRRKTADQWALEFHDAGLPAERVRTLEEALAHDQLSHRSVLHKLGKIAALDQEVTVPVTAFTFAADGPEITSPPPFHGEHTDEVLREFGYQDVDMFALRRDGVI
ncbi:MAG: CoA transferase [Mesorhizobium sp.]|uniref:CaiB/BaiF CoA transferase family protein n=1 Tax=Mesorhizobium sp. TaxID=1871066 RepID=UPI000FE6F620|nr:CaiB/BaiF CoA-transferase family protein [Mesorhizobium sp.]RWB32261.1 MAG: CoA transferase [Mesorhizobium sp.]RWB80436.1 MAG: CoA transferase [Mesorhizobium sp.]RWF78305.1 MAG: CoA transferase [Mesorhizobium sp.]TIS68572.1 MAG: CoA transferase [Mesorhizobium sp.]TIW47977.1 MAG: CoA transferase [Mesorhizobium sp.]